MTDLPLNWYAYKTAEGKEYYYNAKTKVTTWTRPTSIESNTNTTSSTVTTTATTSKEIKSSSIKYNELDITNKNINTITNFTNEMMKPRINLLSEIHKGTKLKKVNSISSSSDITSTSTTIASSNPNVSSSNTLNSNNNTNDLFSAIKSGASNLKKTNKSINHERIESNCSNQRGIVGGTPTGGGGFAEIMRKNREAALKKAGSIGNSTSIDTSISTSSTNVDVKKNSISISDKYINKQKGTTDLEIEERLSIIEKKLDLIISHFKIKE